MPHFRLRRALNVSWAMRGIEDGPRDERGASMLEFAIAAPVLFVAILGFFDIIQWMSVKQMLDEAVGHAGQIASTVPNLDIDATGEDSNGVPFKRLVMARNKANQAGADFLSSLGGTIGLPGNPTGSSGNAFEFVYTEDRQLGDPVEFRSAVMTLLPGDCATVPALGEQVCNDQNMGHPLGGGRPVGTSQRLMEKHAIEIVAFARTNGFLPWAGSRVIRSAFYTARQPVPKAPFGADEDPLLSTGGEPTPYATPGDPLPAAETATPTPLSCVPDAAKCVKASVVANDGKPQAPQNLYDAMDGKCACTSNRSLWFH